MRISARKQDARGGTPAVAGTSPIRSRPPVTKRRLALGLLCVTLVVLAAAYTQRERYTDDLAELSRSLIGDEAITASFVVMRA